MNKLILLLLYSITSGCMSESIKVKKEPSQSKTVNYLALGDSYTIGELVPQSGSFPYQLFKGNLGENINSGNIEVIATTGWTTTDLLTAIKNANLPSDQYDFITLLIGVNNQFQEKDIQIYHTELQELIKTAIKLIGGDGDKVVVVTIPDYGVTPFAQAFNPEKISNEIDKYNLIAEKYAKDYKTRFIDINPISKAAKEDNSLLTTDLLHPSAKQYKMWADLIRLEIIDLLSHE